MTDQNLFTLLSAYRPGASATPFENYCTSARAYQLQQGQPALGALFAGAADDSGATVVETLVQQDLVPGLATDLLLTFDSGKQALVEVEVEAGAAASHLEGLAEAASAMLSLPPILLTLPGTTAPPPWRVLSWRDVVEAVRRGGSGLDAEFAEFVERDILGLGTVPLEQALATNRLYALGAAAVRRRFGEAARYVNSASRPTGGRYRYLGTTFSFDGDQMNYWIGLVNEAIPLSDHYYLMLASKQHPVARPVEHPRATAEWKWAHWTSHGRVVRPLTAELYDELLQRISTRG